MDTELSSLQNDRPEGPTQIPVCSANSCATQGPQNQMERQMLERQRKLQIGNGENAKGKKVACINGTSKPPGTLM